MDSGKLGLGEHEVPGIFCGCKALCYESRKTFRKTQQHLEDPLDGVRCDTRLKRELQSRSVVRQCGTWFFPMGGC